ncbi:MAG: hypothetical protein FWE33_08280 [Defluviitaleaceae bacterium]|nr:hypothetical protein [Defluviitaleaceae bacterium]
MQMDEPKMELLIPDVVPAPSAARIRYTKNPEVAEMPQQSRSAAKPVQEKTWRERIVVQAMICGGFLAALLLFSVLDNPVTNNVTDWVERNLSYNILSEEGGVGAWADRLLGIFGDDEVLDVIDVYAPTQFTPPANLPVSSPDDSWIDPNLLQEISEEADIYYENNR